MRPAARLSLVALGIGAAVYGTASLTGAWLGTPPWWGTLVSVDYKYGQSPEGSSVPMSRTTVQRIESNREFGWTAATSGLCLAAFGAWPRRRRPTATT